MMRSRNAVEGEIAENPVSMEPQFRWSGPETNQVGRWRHGFYILNAMHACDEKRWFQTIVLLTVTITLLLALLIPQPLNHSGTMLATIHLLPMFLFGIIEAQTAYWPLGSLEGLSCRPSPCRPSLFNAHLHLCSPK
jgi:hypothetical protein